MTEAVIRQDPAELRAHAELVGPEDAAKLRRIADDLETDGRHEKTIKLTILPK